ncbi:hypothetical protein cyc_03193 [Cyclospora cayetanensis]|uniref:Uncharacterized protein n=1 Tax=Cyclospora cayetanensis TaxID=88456 RepID=A0A1D3D9L2_9EIME|nr:hypothetical protein cyc_03193 [Cyclospora cayetanensis]
MPEGSPESSRDSQSLRSKGRAAAHPVAAAAARSLYAVRVTSRRPPALADLVAVSLGSQREKLAERAKTALGAAAFTRSVSIGMQDQRRTAEDDAQATKGASAVISSALRPSRTWKEGLCQAELRTSLQGSQLSPGGISSGGPLPATASSPFDGEAEASSHEGAAFMPVEEQVQGPAPVFASGNADLERRLLQTFSALSLPSFAPSTTGPPAAAPTVAARASEAPTSVAEGREELPQARQERAGEPAAACSSPTRQHVEDEGTHGERAQPALSAAADREATAAQAAPQHTSNGVQRQPSGRGPSLIRAESPGAWSEATDSTGCTDTPDLTEAQTDGVRETVSLSPAPRLHLL